MSLPTSVLAWKVARNGLSESTCWVIATRNAISFWAWAGTPKGNTDRPAAADAAAIRCQTPTVTPSYTEWMSEINHYGGSSVKSCHEAVGVNPCAC
ncbi:hypothetical protein GCM10010428_24530 [Actinosynnema pretiosum subsp. pretiosum]